MRTESTSHGMRKAFVDGVSYSSIPSVHICTTIFAYPLTFWILRPRVARADEHETWLLRRRGTMVIRIGCFPPLTSRRRSHHHHHDVKNVSPVLAMKKSP